MIGHIRVVIPWSRRPCRRRAVPGNVTSPMTALTPVWPVEIVGHGPGVSLLTGEIGAFPRPA